MAASDDPSAAGSAWSDDVAARPGGYTQTWTQQTQGPDAQAQFDALVLEQATQRRVLDCGCGDGAFTLRVAGVARHVTGLDFSAGMLELAQRHAAQQRTENVAFVQSHARRDVPLSADTFDLAYSRRGPNITGIVPALVRRGGTLLGLHPLPDASAEARYAQGLRHSGLKVQRFEGIDDVLHFPTLQDLAGYLNRFPGMPDVRQPEHRALLRQEAAARLQPGGSYAEHVHYLLWVAQKI
ncbi:class I SAM-dependent methyltransferase [Deinococcus sp. KNUC1210]|uniref:class I SAM-dependent methyltransferase n=1 Tax=Deinococcus sp. KNUC1210 TaxID=2917691 RepID=UPI001EF0E57E|nr:class I SAM-dependent methyltransferase [Deinococcus sp. KNUC1210]ULH16117.1 class I SAM-dependent methyltransferase [Deinococcus sp. KNUC1210]